METFSLLLLLDLWGVLRSIGSIPLTFFITAAVAAAVAISGVGAVGALASSVVDTGNEVMLEYSKFWKQESLK